MTIDEAATLQPGDSLLWTVSNGTSYPVKFIKHGNTPGIIRIEIFRPIYGRSEYTADAIQCRRVYTPTDYDLQEIQ